MVYWEHIQSKYLDHDGRLVQHMSWSPCPEPPCIWKSRDSTYVSGSIEAWLITQGRCLSHRTQRHDTGAIPQLPRCILQRVIWWTTRTETVGPHHWTHPRIQTVQYKGLPNIPGWTERTQWLHQQKPIKWPHPSLEAADGVPSLLCQEEGWKTMIHPGLPKA